MGQLRRCQMLKGRLVGKRVDHDRADPEKSVDETLGLNALLLRARHEASAFLDAGGIAGRQVGARLADETQ